MTKDDSLNSQEAQPCVPSISVSCQPKLSHFIGCDSAGFGIRITRDISETPDSARLWHCIGGAERIEATEFVNQYLCNPNVSIEWKKFSKI
jgi:hypothetical protein